MGCSRLSIEEIKDSIGELKRAGVCSWRVPVTLLITKGVEGAAQTNLSTGQKL
ncbi:MAG: hypothetical protein N5P05_001142 [Chroococcopsis gigantea SAG 12.99]|jgi:hypothetical protein|nr:hypothetical protein [Chroococcopsis gigantea SAG 12.99]